VNAVRAAAGRLGFGLSLTAMMAAGTAVSALPVLLA